MRRKAALGAFAALAALLAPECFWHQGGARAQDAPAGPKVAIKLDRRPAAGERIRVVEEVQDTRKTTSKEAGREPVVDDETEERALEYEREIIEMERATVVAKERRTFSKFRLKRGKAAAGAAQDEDRSLEGKTAILTRGPGGNDAAVEGSAKPGELALDYLAGEKEREAEHELPDSPFAPPAQLAVGESWRFDIKKFIASLGSPFSDSARWDLDGSQATGTLARAFDRDGARYAELKISVRLKCRGLGTGDFTEGGTFALDGTFEACVDGTRPDFALELAQTFSGTLKTAADAGGQEVVLSTSTKVKERRWLVRDGAASKPSR